MRVTCRDITIVFGDNQHNIPPNVIVFGDNHYNIPPNVIVFDDNYYNITPNVIVFGDNHYNISPNVLVFGDNQHNITPNVIVFWDNRYFVSTTLNDRHIIISLIHHFTTSPPHHITLSPLHSFTTSPLRRMITIDLIAHKIIPFDKLSQKIHLWRFKEQRIVFTNGCFDLLHQGHINTLTSAADHGTRLIVGLNTDASINRLKGPDRPIQDQYTRSLILASLSFVDAVVLFDDETPLELIRLIQPDVLVKGGDYKPADIVGYDIVTAREGIVVTVPYIEGFSTTNIIERIQPQPPL
jgi:rfaE bifunctional protein nucleotidyltransferase chain/domain